MSELKDVLTDDRKLHAKYKGRLVNLLLSRYLHCLDAKDQRFMKVMAVLAQINCMDAEDKAMKVILACFELLYSVYSEIQ